MIKRLLRRLTDPAGRTLIELLVAMAIASMVTLMLGSIVILGLRFSRSSQFEDQRVYPVRNGFDRIVQDLRLTEGTLPCGTGATPTVVLRQKDNSLEFVQYAHDPASKRVVRYSYPDWGCTAGTETTIAYQITDFRITFHSGARFTVFMEARSNDPDSTPFRITQEVMGRVAGGP